MARIVELRNSDTFKAVDCRLRLSKIHDLEPLPTENGDPLLQEDNVVCFLRKRETLLNGVDQEIPHGGDKICFMRTL